MAAGSMQVPHSVCGARAPLAAGIVLALAGAAALAIVLLFFDTARSMVAIWHRSETFSHGFLVVPIAVWLVWQRREALRALPVRPAWPALAGVAAAGFVWLVGTLADAAVVQHFALVAMVQAAVLAIVGWRFARALAFPLLFLLFAVPFGEAFVPTMIDWTADFTVAALKLTGVPVYREGNFFVIPSGMWSVVEACSGVRYLIASLMLGVMFANLMYRSRRRRLAFVAASIAVPIVANWLRAYLIVMLGHLTENRLAVGIDHLIYGWVFFGFVIALLFWIGVRFREAPASEAPASEAPASEAPASEAPASEAPASEAPASEAPASEARVAHFAIDPAPRAGVVAAALAAVLAAGVWVALGAALAQADERPRAIPAIEAAHGWMPVSATFDWQLRFSGYRASARQTFERDGERVTVYIVYYAGGGMDPLSSSQRLVDEDDAWREIAGAAAQVGPIDGARSARVSTLAGAGGRFSVLWWYWVDGVVTDRGAVAHARIALARLRGAADSAAVFVFTEPSDRDDGRARLARFAAEIMPSIDRALAGIRDGTGR